MKATDQILFNLQIFSRHRARSVLILIAVAMGVAAVILLTGLGEGARRYVDREFQALGNKVVVILPGRKETTGGAPPMFSNTARDLTLEDAQALRRIPSINAVAPVIAGTALAAYENRSREVITMGSTRDLFIVRQMTIARGRSFPPETDDRAQPVVIIGAKLQRELFGEKSGLGEWMRLGDRRFRVIGVLAERGESLGLDMRDMAIIPVRSAEQMFNAPGLFRILLELKPNQSFSFAEQQIYQIIRERHDGEEDVTIITQDSVISSFNNIIATLTVVVGAIASISLVVAGILIMNVSLVSVSQRRQEIGLLKALGASALDVRQLFLGESLMLVVFGSAIGVLFAQAVFATVKYFFPSVPLAAPWWAIVSAVLVAVVCGLLFSWWPAHRAAKLDPVLAMRS